MITHLRSFALAFAIVSLRCGPTHAATVEFSPDVLTVPASTLEAQQKGVTLKLFNKGAQAIPLIEVKTSCGCLAVRGMPNVIPANSSVDVELGFREKKRLGPFSVTVAAKAGHEGEVIASATVRGIFLPSDGVLVEPPEMDFGRVAKDQVRDKGISVTVLTKMGEPHTKKSNTVDIDERVERRLNNVDLGTTTYDYRVRVRGGGEKSGEITIDVDRKHIVVPVKFVNDELALVIPSAVTIEPRAAQHRDIKILLADGAEIPQLPAGLTLIAGRRSSLAYREFFLKVDKPDALERSDARIEIPVTLKDRKSVLGVTIIR